MNLLNPYSREKLPQNEQLISNHRPTLTVFFSFLFLYKVRERCYDVTRGASILVKHSNDLPRDLLMDEVINEKNKNY